MITQLSITNFALIERLSLDLEPGFSIITGETGAGKSILLGALGLVLGKRADVSSVKDASQKCVVEAHFEIGNYRLEAFFESADLDYDSHTILRREILPTGKSRAFVNDSPVNLQQLQELGERLLDIHSQHETLSLSDESFQFDLLDSFGGNGEMRSQFGVELSRFRKVTRELERLRLRQSEAEKEKSYHQFLLEELLSANLKEGEQQDLEQSLSELSHVESIQEHLGKAIAVIDSEEFGLRLALSELRQSLQKISGFSESYNQLSERVSQVQIELSDIASEMDRLNQRIVSDPAELERVSDRLQLLSDLQKKHQVQSEAELIVLKQNLETQTRAEEDMQQLIENLQQESTQITAALTEISDELRKKRQASAPDLEQRLLDVLHQLGMPDARLKLEINRSESWNDFGRDSIELLFSANKGIGFQPLKKVASGGELSRLMLAVKATLAQYSKLPTLIFDEIDTGVSGEIADRMAGIMKQMSGNMQVISITHLPQIAAKGDRHFKVFKYADAERTSSGIRLLTEEERVQEIAQMLSGSTLSDSAINHARALLN